MEFSDKFQKRGCLDNSKKREGLGQKGGGEIFQVRGRGVLTSGDALTHGSKWFCKVYYNLLILFFKKVMFFVL